ncbi:CBS domain-containing protein [Streptomyces rimosus subsp. rimosus ATCC 10970]|uniref:CBS domain-containing protein n=1 Tax=Streptomyces rimosus subsp. rimosus (strain ATCC 10970 / DSM 40260 / JCM 4667 / NRRL 2234) TaxID=1265868 RepID=A0A8A1ULV9_STRR1|nr:hypothetical protein [Streptomyces sp. SID5471]QST78845.1 CBS domain-containing protein [Streptomyces rimosus subsp. rimosus ATCC 10970]
MAEAEHAMCTGRLGGLPVVDEQGEAPGFLAPPAERFRPGRAVLPLSL